MTRWDERMESGAELDCTLRRWHVSFRSGTSWYGIGEFVALTAEAAIERAIESSAQPRRRRRSRSPGTRLRCHARARKTWPDLTAAF
jgi:hypothetical protein